MRRNIILSTVAVCCGIVSSSLAEETQHQRTPIVLVKKGRSDSSVRPKAPDRQTVTCEYDGKEMLLSFVMDEGIAIMTVTDETMQLFSYEFDTTPLVVAVTTDILIGTVNIELTTEKGNTFQGIIE